MLAARDTLGSASRLARAHVSRLAHDAGADYGRATLITVMTIVQGANVYVDKSSPISAPMVFQIAAHSLRSADFNIIITALNFKKIELEDMRAVAEGWPLACNEFGATASGSRARDIRHKEVTDVILRTTPSMVAIDTPP